MPVFAYLDFFADWLEIIGIIAIPKEYVPIGPSCHSEEQSDEESLTIRDNLGMRETLRCAQSDKITERIYEIGITRS